MKIPLLWNDALLGRALLMFVLKSAVKIRLFLYFIPNSMFIS